MEEEIADKGGGNVAVSTWERVTRMDLPQQTNEYVCHYWCVVSVLSTW